MLNVKERNRKTGIYLASVACAMVGLAYASVPLYQLFCQVTGFAGTPGRGDVESLNEVSVSNASPVMVYLNTDTKKGAGWRFGAEQKRFELKPGEDRLAFFYAENTSPDALMTQATFNVTPLKAAKYVIKVECFCFEEQVLAAGEYKQMPLSFYIDPELAQDPQTQDVKAITLSYTLFADQIDPAKIQDIGG